VPTVRAYLDTCVVSALAKGDAPGQEVAALQELLSAFQAGRVELTTSPLTLQELSRIPEKHRSPHVEIYNALEKIPQAPTYRITPPFRPTDFPHGKAPHPLLAYLSGILPDRPDAEHVFNALQGGIRWVITFDKATMLRYASDIEAKFGARIRWPSAFLSEAIPEPGN
jgi:predicted nucleic acid-binding protein